MTCTQEQLFGLFATIDKENDRIEGLKEQIKVIQNGPEGIKAEFKQFGKDYEVDVKDLEDAYKYYLKRQKSSEADTAEDYFTLCAMVDSEMDIESDSEGIDEYGNVKG